MRRLLELLLSGVLVLLATALYALAARSGTPAASGLVGHSLGVLGFLGMLVGSFGYSWRKSPARTGPGSLEAWMTAHVIAGIVGPYLVLLHTGFAFRGLAGVAFWAMVLVVASGIVGRYVYARRAMAWWWLLHVPVALAMFALAAFHTVAALYYATLLR